MRQNLVLVKVLEKIGTVWLRLQFLGLVLIKTEEDVYLFVQEQVCESAERGNKTELTRRSRLTRTRGAVRRHFGEICPFFFYQKYSCVERQLFLEARRKKKKSPVLLLHEAAAAPPGWHAAAFLQTIRRKSTSRCWLLCKPEPKTAQVVMHHWQQSDVAALSHS